MNAQFKSALDQDSDEIIRRSLMAEMLVERGHDVAVAKACGMTPEAAVKVLCDSAQSLLAELRAGRRASE